ncbi:class I SAM-dependent methyltransferase [Actinokineospora sp. PR83]|uniref:class I SAM-dependent methyltransferase n=1 Tax=Actinokineospora sp. PR83 TaxID=2884908 RepID=UPI001F25EB28|nr:class I SAM-dependent methyltransferase [Actinokineospora sp. PR83]MCG8915906.1 class I SAM-dependent methyltransferase [Actinokineospora sp. PR83]
MTATNGWVAEDYAQVNAPHLRTALAALSFADEALVRGGAFAEIGCGTGEVARTAAERGFEVWACDASASMVDATRRLCAGLPVRAEVCPAEEADLPPERFTVVHSSWVLHWLTEVEEPLRRMARSLRPGGYLVLQWTGAQPRSQGPGMFGILREIAGSPKWRDLLAEVQPAVHEYPADEVAAVVEGAGLELTHYDPELAHPFSAKGPGPTMADLPDLRKRYKLAGFAAQAAALGDRADEFVDEVLGTMIRAGRVDPHHARVVARRPA